MVKSLVHTLSWVFVFERSNNAPVCSWANEKQNWRRLREREREKNDGMCECETDECWINLHVGRGARQFWNRRFESDTVRNFTSSVCVFICLLQTSVFVSGSSLFRNVCHCVVYSNFVCAFDCVCVCCTMLSSILSPWKMARDSHSSLRYAISNGEVNKSEREKRRNKND